MNDLVIGAIVAFVFFLLSLRPTAPDARTLGQVWELVRTAGWGAVTFGAVRVVLVAALLVLGDLFRMTRPALSRAPALADGALLLLGALVSALMALGRARQLGGIAA